MNEYQELIAQAKENLAMDERIAEYAALMRRKKEMEAECEDIGHKAFRLNAQNLFDAHPELESFGWSQYTPYYCDGDPCYFRCNTEYPTVNEYYEGDGPGEADLFYSPAKHDELYKIVQEFLEPYSNEEMLAIFGDHAEITITKEGITVEEYQHD